MSRPTHNPARGLRLMIYDTTCRGQGVRPGLTHSWIAGGYLYRALGRLDDFFGARSWSEALRWLSTTQAHRPIDEIQFWGHGKWGYALIGRERLDVSALEADHPLHGSILTLRDRLSGPEALWWFRTCETFGAAAGHHFARSWTRFFDCRAAGHTCIIGPFQSGLYSLDVGQEPYWPVDEGIIEGTPESPRRAYWSRPERPRTITCLHGAIPDGW
jgi:hypothetical protein